MMDLTADDLELILRWAETIDYDYGLSEKEVALRAKLEALEAEKRLPSGDVTQESGE
jgi:hypothetical protein